MSATVEVEHPAKWSKSVLAAVADVVAAEAEREDRRLNVLDPFAGVGRARLADAITANAAITVLGVDLQPEWAAMDTDGLTAVGDATAMSYGTGAFDVVATSPTFGNRMADKHDAQDVCKACGGVGRLGPATGARQEDYGRECRTCKGHGKSRRNTYAHALARAGVDLVPGSAASIQWGPAYRDLHDRAIREFIRVLVPGGLIVVNMSNHVRGGVEQDVVEWWVNTLLWHRCRMVEVRPVPTPRQRMGANGDARVDNEFVIAVRTPNPRRDVLL